MAISPIAAGVQIFPMAHSPLSSPSTSAAPPRHQPPRTPAAPLGCARVLSYVEPPPSGFELQKQSRHRHTASSTADLRSPYLVVVLPPSTSSMHVQQQPLPLRVDCADTDLRSPDAMLSNFSKTPSSSLRLVFFSSP
uniref:Uncharacterized protein n=1 Tax=Zea mays TaxID=4577 RepID=A0A804LPR7_MAIZE